jgi:hypothetical protein
MRLDRLASSLSLSGIRTMNDVFPEEIVWQESYGHVRFATLCSHCRGDVLAVASLQECHRPVRCRRCRGAGWLGIDPREPTTALPGTVAKQAVLAARVAAGVPLWNDGDGIPRLDDSRQRELLGAS